MLSTLLETLIGTFESTVAAETLQQELVESRLIRVSDDLGGEAASLAAQVKAVPASPEAEGAGLSTLTLSRVTLSRLYADRRRRADVVLGVSVALAGAFGAAVIGAMILNITPDINAVGLQMLAGVTPGFLSGGLFWLYARERSDLRAIEKDLASLEILERRLEVVVAIDPPSRAAAYTTILGLMQNPR